MLLCQKIWFCFNAQGSWNTKEMLLFSIKDRHYISTDEKCSWTHSRLGNILARGRGASIPGFLYLQIWTLHPHSFLWGFVKHEVSLPPVTKTLNNLGGRIQKVTVNTEQLLLQNVFAGHIQPTFTLYTHGIQKLSECLFTTACLYYLRGYYFLTNKFMLTHLL